MRNFQAVLALLLAAVAACLVAGIVVSSRRVTRAASLEELAGPEDLNVHLRASADSLAWACGGKEVADVCLLSTDTCVQVRKHGPLSRF